MGGGGGAAPLRYGFTSTAWDSFSPWNDQVYSYSLGQINKGYNPLSNLEVVSALNTVNISTQMYAYSPTNRTAKYYPKVYIGPSKTIGQLWLYDIQNGTETTLPNWPNSYQSSQQKGEANY